VTGDQDHAGFLYMGVVSTGYCTRWSGNIVTKPSKGYLFRPNSVLTLSLRMRRQHRRQGRQQRE
jgi:hypothetical protein